MTRGGICVGESQKQSSWWKDLCRICDVRNQDNWFDNSINWVLRDGKQIKLWKDRWIESQPLKERFPRLYSLTLCSEEAISEVGEWVTLDNDESFKWKLSWRRELFEWEKELQQQLHSILSTTQWNKNGLDVWVWGLNDRLGYTVRFGYALLEREGNSTTKEAFQIL